MKKILTLVRIYDKTFNSKFKIISYVISALILLVFSVYSLIISRNEYFYDYRLFEYNYFATSSNLLVILLIFIIMLSFFKEGSLCDNSLNVMLEADSGREYVFFAKQLSFINSIFIISSSLYIAVFIPPFHFYILFKIPFLKNYLILFLYLLILLELFLFFDYLFKNYYISFAIGIIAIIFSFIKSNYLSYIIPTLRYDNFKFYFDISIYYVILYGVIIFMLNFIIYLRSDRN